jgi:DNA-directed RNA polymerase subunit RPC12/RpoP
MRVDKCGNCGRPFEVLETGGGMPGSKEPEEISCPHCDYTTTERSNGVFRTFPLSAEAEKEWLEKEANA